MPELRAALENAGFKDLQTYLQSGNLVFESRAKPETVARRVEQLIAARFGLEIDVVVRSRDELAKIVQRNPLGKVAKNPKRHQVTFLSAELAPEVVERLDSLPVRGEQLVVHGREVYAWHPAGVARSRLWSELAGKRLGVTATSRNWTTVEALLALAQE
jgi:uncharacterized protein (DUF1697 family)